MKDYSFFQECFSYDPDSGALAWRVRPESHFASPAVARQVNSRMAGKPAATKPKKNRCGYKTLEIEASGERVGAHRVCWSIHHRKNIPDGMEVDHINGDSTDNRASNLRIVDRSSNAMNRRMSKNNASGANGVRFYEKYGKYYASIKVKGKTIHLGSFNTFNEAVKARRDADNKYGFHANHGAARRDCVSAEYRNQAEGNGDE